MLKKIFVVIFSAVTILAFTACGDSENSARQDYSTVAKNTYKVAEEIKLDLAKAAENLSTNDAEGTVAKLTQSLDGAKDKISLENQNLSNAEVPEKFADSNKKILECLKIEYNLIDRLKENISNPNEYEAVENFNKSKELVINLKEQAALLNVEGNNFENVFELSSVCQKIENYLNTKKQLRYNKDSEEQAKRDAAERAKSERPNVVVVERNNSGSSEQDVGIYPATGLRAYLLTDSISRWRDGFSCTVVCYPSGRPYYINYTFNQTYDGFSFSNSDGYTSQVHSYNTPVEYNVWRYVW